MLRQMLLNELLSGNETFSNPAFINHQTNYKSPSNLAAELSDSSSSSCNLTSLSQCQSNKFGSASDGELMKEKSKNAARSRREKENAEVSCLSSFSAKRSTELELPFREFRSLTFSSILFDFSLSNSASCSHCPSRSPANWTKHQS